MSDRDSAYDHQSDVAGGGTRGDESAANEHRDTAHGDAGERNELRPDERGRAEGPTTHDDTRVTRKDGA